MTTSTIHYQGSLRTIARHTKSGIEVISDAPLDNHGKGEAFSPTDYCATSLAMCMLTIAGIHADGKGYSIENSTAEVVKTMAAAPRRIAKIEVKLVFDIHTELTEKEKFLLEASAINCPVAKSLHPEIEQVVSISYSK